MLEIIKDVKAIKTAILKSRYIAARLASGEMLKLYFAIGGYVSTNSRKGHWGTGVIDEISAILQKELPGLRGVLHRTCAICGNSTRNGLRFQFARHCLAKWKCPLILRWKLEIVNAPSQELTYLELKMRAIISAFFFPRRPPQGRHCVRFCKVASFRDANLQSVLHGTFFGGIKRTGRLKRTLM